MAPSPPLVTLEEAREYLGKTTVADDSTLERLLSVASMAAEEYADAWLGPSQQTFTRSCDGRRGVILRRPIRSVTSVTLSGVALTTGSWCLNSADGILYRGPVPGAGMWPVGADNLVVICEVGPTEPSPMDKHAVFEMLRHLWETQRGGPDRSVRGDEWTSALGYTFPNRVMGLLNRTQIPGMG